MRRFRERLAGERGFTLVELLVVVLIIGILAAIALTVFLGQKTKANDAASKDAVAALSVDVASCFTEDDDYSQCATRADLKDDGLPIDDAITAANNCTGDPAISPADSYPDVSEGKVAVVAAATNCYVIEGRSKDGDVFWSVRRADAPGVRTCAPPGNGGCASDGSWSHV